MLIRSLPFVFALLWSTGFIGAKYGLPYIQPYSFLALRFIMTLALLGLVLLIMKPPFPRKAQTYWHLLLAGILIHVAYLGGVFSAIKLGMPAGVTAVIVGVQPLLTVLLIQRLSSLKLLFAAAVGFLGLILVLFRAQAGAQDLPTADWSVYLPAIIALLGITLGTLYQKKHCADVHIISSAFLQYIPTGIIFVALAVFFETGSGQTIEWHAELIFALLWLVVVLSVGAVVLMNLLYQHNSASGAASYFYLSPPFALLLSYFLFDETMSLINIVGILLIVASLYLTSRFQLAAKS